MTLQVLDEWVAITFLSIMLLGTALYMRRVRAHGRLNYERIAAVGDGAVVRQGVFEMGYWWMQPIARSLVSIGFTANGVTWVSLAMWLGCGGLAAAGYFGLACLVGTVAAFADTLDGLVARLRQTNSEAGEILDGTVDRYGDVIVFGGIAIFYNGVVALQLLALGALAGAMAVSHASSKSEALRIDVSKGFMRRPERCVTLLVGLGLSGITGPTIETALHINRVLALPLVVALTLIASVGNLSAISRLRELAIKVR